MQHRTKAKSISFADEIMKEKYSRYFRLRSLKVIPWGGKRQFHPREMLLQIIIKYPLTNVDYRLCKCHITFLHLKQAILTKMSIRDSAKFIIRYGRWRRKLFEKKSARPVWNYCRKTNCPVALSIKSLKIYLPCIHGQQMFYSTYHRWSSQGP